MAFLRRRIEWGEVKRFFLDEIRHLSRRWLTESPGGGSLMTGGSAPQPLTLRLSLSQLTTQQVRAAFQSQVFSRGSGYYRAGRVTGLSRQGSKLVAWVHGSRAQPYLVQCDEAAPGRLRCACACPFARDWAQPCKHLAAALLAWVAQRRDAQGAAWTGAAAPAHHHGPSTMPPASRSGRRSGEASPRFRLRPFLRGAPFWSATGGASGLQAWRADPLATPPMAWWLATEFFSGAGSLRAEVTLAEESSTLLVTLKTEAGLGRQATLLIPRDELPSFVAQCRHAPDLAWRGPARALGLRVRPVEPRLMADYDAEGRLVLERRYTLPAGGGRAVSMLTAQELEAGRVGGTWFLDGRGGVYPIASVPRRLRHYWAGEAPLVYEGAAIPQFLETAYRRLLDEIAFRPSQAVRRTRVLPLPRVSHVKLDLDGPDWLWCEPTYLARNHEVALSDILAAQAHGSYLRKGDDWIRLPSRAELAETLGGAEPASDGRVRLSRLQFLRARSEWDAQVRLEESDPARRFRELIDRLAPPADPPPLDGRMTALRPYQEAGYRWLWFLHASGFHGLLADEMGLGKTHQAMALLSAAQTEGSARPSLVICPTTVLDHWEEKLRRHAPALRCLRVHGLERPRALMGVALPPVVLTTYALLAKDAAIFEPIEWDYVILDEAQKIKNPVTKMARAAKRLRARHRLTLTGTPMENRPIELWSVFEFLLPGYLGSASTFRRRFETPIVQRGDAAAMERLRRLVHPFKLRRCKAEVLKELPPKVEDVRRCELSPHQAALYRASLEQAGELIDGLRDRSRPIEYIHIFALLTRLKRICDHPALVLTGRRARRLSSGKFAVFQELLEDVLASGQKVVVFSQYLEMLDLIAEDLVRRGVGFALLRGDTSNRGQVIAT